MSLSTIPCEPYCVTPTPSDRLRLLVGRYSMPALAAKLLAGDVAAGDGLGYSVSVSGDTAVIGANRDDDGGNDSGAAYVFTRAGTIWKQEAKLTAASTRATTPSP